MVDSIVTDVHFTHFKGLEKRKITFTLNSINEAF